MTDIEQMEADAEKAREEADESNLQELGVKALELEEEIAEAEGRANALKKKLERIMRYSIPEALAVAGIPEFGFAHNGGMARISSGTKVVGSLNYAEDKDAAIAYLEEQGLKGVVKTKVSLDFDMTEQDAAENLISAMRQKTNRPISSDQSIHPQTLISFAKGKLKEDPTFDYEKVGLTAIPEARFLKRT